MQTKSDHGNLALAQAKFDPVARVLDRLSKDIETEYGRSAVLKSRGSMQQMAGNAYAVRYTLRDPEEARLSLTFLVVGGDADLLLLKGQDRSGSRDARADPGQVDRAFTGCERSRRSRRR